MSNSLPFPGVAHVPILGQQAEVKAILPIVMIQCKCASHSAILLIGGTIGLCASCGKRFLLKKLAFDAQTGQISVEIGMVLGSGNLASSSSPEQPTN